MKKPAALKLTARLAGASLDAPIALTFEILQERIAAFRELPLSNPNFQGYSFDVQRVEMEQAKKRRPTPTSWKITIAEMDFSEKLKDQILWHLACSLLEDLKKYLENPTPAPKPRSKGATSVVKKSSLRLACDRK